MLFIQEKINQNPSFHLLVCPTYPFRGSTTIARGWVIFPSMRVLRVCDAFSRRATLMVFLGPSSVQYKLSAIQSTAIPSTVWIPKIDKATASKQIKCIDTLCCYAGLRPVGVNKTCRLLKPGTHEETANTEPPFVANLQTCNKNTCVIVWVMCTKWKMTVSSVRYTVQPHATNTHFQKSFLRLKNYILPD